MKKIYMDRENLILAFKEAKENKTDICVEIKLPEQKTTEKIINNYESLDIKLNYYLDAYNEDLTHKHNGEIRIVKAYPVDWWMN